MALFYRFGSFRLDPEFEALYRGNEPIALGRRAAALLRALVERPGVLVSKDELIAAAWPGLAVEDSNLTVQIAALRRVLEDAGGEHRIVTLPRRGYRFVGPVVTEECGDTGVAATEVTPTLALPDKPSIAVLPFTNMSSDPEQEYFTDGIVEEIITALSRFSSLFVIARNTSFTYKGRSVDVKEVGHELGVRYVLEGSVRKSANRLRITGQLIDAATGVHLWADRFEGALEDIFDLQDQVTTSVVGAITPKLEQVEIERSKRKPTDSLDAHDYYLRGCESLYQQTRESTSEALALFTKAIQRDPGFSLAYAMAAFCYTQRKAFGWIADRARETTEAARLARRAVELGKDDAVALSRAGLTLAYVVEDLHAGALFIDRALVLNPNLSTAWFASGQLRVWIGEPEIAIRLLERFIRMSPLDPIISRAYSAIAFAHVFAERFEEAVRYADRALSERPKCHPSLRAAATSNALAGRIEQARTAVARLREIDPGLRVSGLKNLTPLQRPQDARKYAEGMRLAGLPE
jgi:TolB-like protein